MANISCYTRIDVPANFWSPNTPHALSRGCGMFSREHPPATDGAAGVAALITYGYQFNEPRETFAGSLTAVKVADGYHPRWLLMTGFVVWSTERPDNRVQWHVAFGWNGAGRAQDVDPPVALETIPGPATVLVQTLVDDGAGGFDVVWRGAFVET